MSFDLYIESKPCPTCGREYYGDHCLNITHNLNEMVETAMRATGCQLKGTDPSRGYVERSWGRLHGHPITTVLPVVAAVNDYIRKPENEAELKAMNPSNGWGSLDGLREFTARFLQHLTEAPDDAYVRASG